MKERRSPHRTQWAAQFAVASELCKKNYQVAFTMGNHPAIDLMVISPKGTQFTIDVKGLYERNFWGVSNKPKKNSLFYVFAFVPNESSNRYFVLTQTEVNKGVQKHIEGIKKRRLEKGQSIEKSERFPGLPWSLVEKHENQWDKLPG